MILKPKDVYSHRPLPYIIGSFAWKNKWHAGKLVCEYNIIIWRGVEFRHSIRNVLYCAVRGECIVLILCSLCLFWYMRNRPRFPFLPELGKWKY